MVSGKPAAIMKKYIIMMPQCDASQENIFCFCCMF